MEDPATAATGTFGVSDDPAVLAGLAPPSEPEGDGPALIASFLSLVDSASSRVLDHPIRPRVKATPRGMLRGELDVVKIEIPAVLASGLVLDRIVVRAEHVRVVPGFPPRFRAGPVGLRAFVSQRYVDQWTKATHLPIRVQLTAEGVVLTTGLRGIKMTETLAELEVVGRFLRLAPQRMTIVGLPTPMIRFFRGYLPLPPLPNGARIVDVQPGEGQLAVTFQIEEIDEALTPDLARRLPLFARLPIPGLG